MQRSSIQIILLFLWLQIFSATTAINTRMRKTNKVNLRKKYEVEKTASHNYSSTCGFPKFKNYLDGLYREVQCYLRPI